MTMIVKDPATVTGVGTTFGAKTGPRTLNDVVGATGDYIPLTRGGVLVTEEDQPVVADTDTTPPAGG